MTHLVSDEREAITQHIKIPRHELVASLRERDGDMCAHPDCGRPLDYAIKEGSLEVTIDHWYPQYAGKAEGWTMEEIWSLDNLRLMHKKCNAKKGDLIPNADGTLPEKVTKTFRYRRDKRASRPELCTACDNGHNLAADEVCASCGCDAQRFPRWAKVKTQECDHELFWCIWCSIGVIERPTSIAIAMRQGDSDELGEYMSDS